MRADVAATLRAGHRPPIYLLYGEDAYSRSQCGLELANALAAASAGGADLNRFEAGSATLEEIASAVMTAPMFGGERVVMMGKFEELGDGDQSRFIVALCPGPRQADCAVAPDTTVIISYAAKSVPKKLTELAGASMACFEFKPANAREAAEFVRQAAREIGLAVDYQAVMALIDLVGFDLGALGGELEKLALFVGPGQRSATADDVRAAVGANPTQSVWNFCDAVIAGDASSAHACLARMNKEDRHALSIQGTMASQLRLVMSARSALDKGAPPPGGQSYRTRKAADQARGLGQPTLARMISRLARADREIKTGVVGDELCMDLLVSDMCDIVRQAKQKPPR